MNIIRPGPSVLSIETVYPDEDFRKETGTTTNPKSDSSEDGEPQ